MEVYWEYGREMFVQLGNVYFILLFMQYGLGMFGLLLVFLKIILNDVVLGELFCLVYVFWSFFFIVVMLVLWLMLLVLLVRFMVLVDVVVLNLIRQLVINRVWSLVMVYVFVEWNGILV